MSYLAKSAVLFLIFNRPKNTREVFEKIKEAKPPRLYIAADGPRENKDEVDKCLQAREVAKLVDWECKVYTLFREENLGCKNAVSSALDWFFSNENEGIILEDDCLPSNDFFRFCDTLLEKYRQDTRIRHISGCNLQHGQIWGEASYYFSKMTHVWGWASWKRVWNDYDKNLERYENPDVYGQFLKIFNDSLIAESWTQIFHKVKAGEIDTWDYQLTLINFFNNSLSIIPNSNLISNIGFGEDATHTFTADDPNANIGFSKLPDHILHPVYILSENHADFYTLNQDFQIELRHEMLKKEAQKKKGLKRILYFLKDRFSFKR